MLSISVIVPVYDVAPYVERCVRSVMAQDYAGEAECIIVDDGSTDGSIDIVAGTIKEYSGKIQFRIIRHEHNLGLSEARNTGIDASTGDYILFLDSDDELSIHALSLMADAAAQHPGVDMVAGEYYLCGKYSAYHSHNAQEYINGNLPCRRELLREGTMLDTAHNKLMRRSLITGNGLRFRHGLYYEDNIWRWDYAKRIESILYLGTPTMVHFNNPGSIVNRTSAKHLSDSLRIIELKLASIDSADPDGQLRNIITHFASILANKDFNAMSTGSNDTGPRISGIISDITRKATNTGCLRAAVAITAIRLGKLTGSPSILQLSARIARKATAL